MVWSCEMVWYPSWCWPCCCSRLIVAIIIPRVYHGYNHGLLCAICVPGIQKEADLLRYPGLLGCASGYLDGQAILPGIYCLSACYHRFRLPPPGRVRQVDEEVDKSREGIKVPFRSHLSHHLIVVVGCC